MIKNKADCIKCPNDFEILELYSNTGFLSRDPGTWILCKTNERICFCDFRDFSLSSKICR